MTFKLYKISLFFSCLLLLGVLAASGIVLMRTWREYKTIFHLEISQTLELEQLRNKNENYRAHIIQMLNDKEFVEYIARQTIGYIKNDEILFRFD
ncbi:MAG: septum formation initiator family protein [Puniceicoccales bacterium]|jgi:cell division protein FtsB|nr:septum formation initiator family protein [Puniceicoccales bacterium]